MCIYLLLPAVQKYCLLLFPGLLVQDVSGGVQTHLGASHTHFAFYCARFEPVMNINIQYIAKTCITWIQSVSGHHPSFCKQKMDQAKGKQKKKRNK